MSDATQWHIRQAQPGNPIVFFGETGSLRHDIFSHYNRMQGLMLVPSKVLT